MSNFGILVRNNLRVFIGSLMKKKRGRYTATIVMVAMVYLLIGASLTFQAAIQTVALNSLGVPELSLYMSIQTAVMIAVVFGLMRGMNASTSRDGEMLLSLPVRRFTVVASKVLSNYIFDSPLIILFLLPTFVTYFIIADASVMMLIRGILLTFLVPLVPLTISYIASAIMNALQNHFRGMKLVTTAIMMGIFVFYIINNMHTSTLYQNIEENGAAGARVLLEKFPPITMMTYFVYDGRAMSVLVTLLILVAPLFPALWLFSLNFGKSARTFSSHDKRLRSIVRSPRMALLGKELKRYFGCVIYVFNTAFGAIMIIALSIAVFIAGMDKTLSFIGISSDARQNFQPFFIKIIASTFFCFFPAVTSTSASSISLEGKQLWILQAHPIKTADIFFAKSMVNVIVMLPASAIGGLLVAVSIKMTLLETVFFLAAITALCAAISLVGLIVNLLFPRFDWDNETQVVKQSASVIVTMLVGSAIASIPYILFFTLFYFRGHGFATFGMVNFLFQLIVIFFSILFLRRKGKKIFEQL